MKKTEEILDIEKTAALDTEEAEDLEKNTALKKTKIKNAGKSKMDNPKTDIVKKEPEIAEVVAICKYNDLQEKRIVNKGERLKVSQERAALLRSMGLAE